MAQLADLDLPDNPQLVQNITYFIQALRRAGLPIGPGRVIDAIRAVQAAGFTQKRDFYYCLQACLITRPEHRPVFAQIFRLYWRDPRFMEHMMSMMLPAIRGVQEDRAARPAEKRAAESLLGDAAVPQPAPPDDRADDPLEITVDASQTASHTERLRSLDFEQMSNAEIAEAKRMLARLTLPVPPLRTRRQARNPRGARIDAAASLRAAMARGGEMLQLRRRAPKTRWPNLVVICDISGSMSQYSRMVLHFLHAVANQKGAGWARVYGFTFGTRLTNITRHLRARDVDAALAAAGAEAQDWEGGTRIGDCLHDFNRDWSRRVLGQGAVVLLITDGLDRGDPGPLGKEMQRLQLSCRRLIWLNPLLRWDAFAAKAQGVRAMLPHVDAFRAGHSIDSLAALAKSLSSAEDGGEKQRLLVQMQSDGGQNA